MFPAPLLIRSARFVQATPVECRIDSNQPAISGKASQLLSDYSSVKVYVDGSVSDSHIPGSEAEGNCAAGGRRN